jgi:ribonuclease J
MDEVTIKDRQRLGRDGLLIVLLRVNKKTWELTHTPELFSMGFMSEEESPEVLEDLKRHIRETFESVIEELKEDENALKTRIRNSLRKFLFKNLERRPIVIPILLDQ